MIVLGFVDDVIELYWPYKFFLPFLATLPLLIAYNGPTHVVIPGYLCSFLSVEHILELGWFYYLFMLIMAIFCTNAINIHAGINGLEAGQSLVIGCFILIHNLIEAGVDAEGRSQHLFSIFLITPFVATTAALLCHNWFTFSCLFAFYFFILFYIFIFVILKIK